MTSRKPTSDEQFGVVNPDDDNLQGPMSELDQLFDHHGFSVLDGPDPVDMSTTALQVEEEDEG